MARSGFAARFAPVRWLGHPAGILGVWASIEHSRAPHTLRSARVEGLISAAADFLAAVLRLFGFIGAPRRRTAIREDLELLRQLGEFPEFERGTKPNEWLSTRVVREIAELSGVDLRTKRRAADLSSIIIIGLIAAALGYLTYWVDAAFSGWLALIPGSFAALFAIATLGMITDKEEVRPDEIEAAQQKLPIDPSYAGFDAASTCSSPTNGDSSSSSNGTASRTWNRWRHAKHLAPAGNLLRG
jgi:hypothetical protein